MAVVVVEEVRPDVQWMVCLRLQLSEREKENSRVKITASKYEYISLLYVSRAIYPPNENCPHHVEAL
jgi:hypothetical protein